MFSYQEGGVFRPVESALANAQLSGPVENTKIDILDSDHPIVSRIPSLFFAGCPAAIGGFIISIIINPIYRVFGGWSWPHVGIEILKRARPSIANLYFSSSVIFVIRGIRVIASLQHALPDYKFLAPGHSMRSHLGGCGLSLQAAAAKGGSPNISGSSYSCVTAVTLAEPHYVFGFLDIGSFFYEKSSKALSCYVQRGSHAILHLRERIIANG